MEKKLPSELKEIEKIEKNEREEIKEAIKPFIEKTVQYITEECRIMGPEYQARIFYDALEQIQLHKDKASRETKILSKYDVYSYINSIWEAEWRRTEVTRERYRTILDLINR